MNNFREATPDDVFHIARLVKRFYHRYGGHIGIPYDHESTLQLILGALSMGCPVAVGEHSCAAASINPFPFNKTARVATVLFWYFDKPREIGIFDFLAQQCIRAGATHISASATTSAPAARGIYERRGLTYIEQTFIGQLNWCLPKAEEVVKDAA